MIYLERTDTIDNATRHSRYKKKVHKEKIGNDFLLVFDESKRMLAVCATDKVIVIFTVMFVACLKLTFYI